MTGSIPRVFIDDLLIRTDIVDLIDKYVPLKKSGVNFVARCPFHTEKTPSFSVNRNKQFYHCFGCGASGDAISFLMAYNHLDFSEAIEDLSMALGLEVPREESAIKTDPKKKQLLSEVYALLEQTAGDFAEQLRLEAGEKAVNYLKARRVSGQVAKQFMLGFAPDGWGFLTQRYDRSLLLAAGLIAENDRGKFYDRFRDRVMYPIRDRRGRVVGFGGRVLDDSLPKYLNSPETDVFHKNQQVYGLFELLKKVPKPDRILITEGYMDVIALVDVGIDYSVACLGTAVSEDHVALLFRFTRNLVFCFDGDKAGRKAAWRAVEAALPVLRDGRQLNIMLLPEGADPDSMVAEEGVVSFTRRIDQAVSMSDYFFERLSRDLSLNSIEGRAALVEKAKPYLQRLPSGTYQTMMFARLKELAKSDSLPVAVLNNPATINSGGIQQRRGGKNRVSPIRTVIALLLQYPELIQMLEMQAVDWEDVGLPGGDLLHAIAQRIESTPNINMAALVAGFHGSEHEAAVMKLAQKQFLIPFEGLQEEFIGAVHRLTGQVREKKLAELIAKQENQGLSDGERKLLLDMLKKH